ncbi:MAG: leucine-rich repeat domain-containing protein [Phormidesmis sp. FL-bin-119]|nr:leucine-rich repeat domain-containing protein [Pedobacter sp.]
MRTKMFIKPFLLSLFFISILSARAMAQDIRDIAGKMSFPDDLPISRFIIALPDSINGISIVYDDLKSITAEKLEKLKKIELVELRFSNQFELDKEIELLANFPSMKYLVLGDWRYNSKTSSNEIKLPEILASYKNIVGLKFSGEWKIDYLHGLKIIKELPNLRYLFFQDFQQPLPEGVKDLKELRGISLQSSKFVDFPEWITRLTKLESISLAMATFSFKGSGYLNYFDALSKLQKLPLLKSIYLSHLYKNEGDYSTLKFDHLKKIELNGVDFKTNKTLANFLTNQKKLQSITISGSSPQVLDPGFSKLKELTELTIIGRKDSLQINFNLKDLINLKTLKLTNVKLFLNGSAFPNNLTRLDLSSMNLRVLPSSILKLGKLKTLSLEYDSLMSLPDNFSDLKRLEQLNLSGNLLKELPSDFGNLKNLKTLNLSSNPINELTETITGLNNLRVLEIRYGNLKNLPLGIGQLQKLEILDVNNNFIEKIPESLTAIKTLKTLQFSFNQLIALPEEIGNMTALEVLNLDFNNIRHVPVSIGLLQAIKKIGLSYNDLDSLPEQIASLRSLQELNLSTGIISDIKRYDNRSIYRKDDPNPTKKLTVNRIRNFPEDLSGWISLKKLNLASNSGINNKQLMKGVFTIPSKRYSLDLQNCGIIDLPRQGWQNFFVASLNLRNNQITEVPSGILQAPYLSEINLNNNRLKTSPINLNQHVANRYEKALWFIDLQIMSDKELPKTDSMVLALINKSNNHYNRKEFKQAVELVNIAVGINDSLAMKKIFLTNMGEANYEVGNYRTAIDYLSRAIKQDTASNVRIMNFVVPDFEFRAKSYLKLGDTASAINDYKTLAENFSDSWGDLGLLYKAIRKSDEANIAFEKGIEKYQDQIDHSRKSNQSVEMQQLSVLELLIIKEDFDRAIRFAADLEKEFKSIQHVTLLRYLKASAEIGNNSFDITSKSELLNFIKVNKKSISGWSYELFFKWLNITKISKDKEILMREISDNIKP